MLLFGRKYRILASLEMKNIKKSLTLRYELEFEFTGIFFEKLRKSFRLIDELFLK